MIYFIQAETGGPVKIGFAYDPNERLKQIQCGSPDPVRIIRIIPGSRKTEANIHQRLKASRKRGEWFDDTEEVRAFIQSVAQYDCEILNGVAYLVLNRAEESKATEPCPFCSKEHIHGIGDGHRAPHCVNPTVTEILIGDATVRQENGYIIRTGGGR